MEKLAISKKGPEEAAVPGLLGNYSNKVSMVTHKQIANHVNRARGRSYDMSSTGVKRLDIASEI